MRASLKNIFIPVTATLMLAMSLTACSAPVAEEASIKPEPSKEAGVFTKDIELCFTNTSGESVTVSWGEGVSSYDGVGTLDNGEQICGEGGTPHAVVAFMDGFQTELIAENLAFMKPVLAFYSMKPDEQAIQNCNASYTYCYFERERTYYDWNEYTQAQTETVQAEGHLINVNRGSDSSWINFSIEIQG